jgi:hypothetical protein
LTPQNVSTRMRFSFASMARGDNARPFRLQLYGDLWSVFAGWKTRSPVCATRLALAGREECIEPDLDSWLWCAQQVDL